MCTTSESPLSPFDIIHFRATRNILVPFTDFFQRIIHIQNSFNKKSIISSKAQLFKWRIFQNITFSLRYYSLQMMCNSPNRCFSQSLKMIAFSTPSASLSHTCRFKLRYFDMIGIVHINNFNSCSCVVMQTKLVKSFFSQQQGNSIWKLPIA